MDFLKRFAAEVQQTDPLPERLALLIAGIAYPDLVIDDYLRQLDVLAEEADALLGGVGAGEVRAQRFLSVINDGLGFRGNKRRYYDPRNSYLNEVLERRLGLPIMLSLVAVAIGRRIGVTVEGIGYPGHFMARYRDAAGSWLLDPFHGNVLTEGEVPGYLAQLFDQPVQLAPDLYVGVTGIDFAQRILNNLRNVYLSAQDLESASRVLDYMLLLLPSSTVLWQERGLLHYRRGAFEDAAHDLQRYFFLNGLLPQAFKMDDDQSPAVSTQDRSLLRLFHQIEEVRTQLN